MSKGTDARHECQPSVDVRCPWSLVQVVLSSGSAGFVQSVKTQVAGRQSLISQFAIRNSKFTAELCPLSSDLSITRLARPPVSLVYPRYRVALTYLVLSIHNS